MDMIRSLHLIGSRQFGGAENFFLRLVQSLAKREDHQPEAAIRPQNPLLEPLRQAGIPLHFVPLRNGWDIPSIFRIRSLVRQTGVQIVQTYMGRGTRLTRLTRSGSAVHVARLGGFYKIDGYYRHAHAWVGNTRQLCDYLVREGLPADKVFHISNFVPTPRIPREEELVGLRQHHDIPADALVLFTLGRFIDIKGFDDMLRAFAKIPGQIGGRPVFLMIGGEGPLRDSLHSLAAELGIEARVRWPGWLKDPVCFFRAADLFVCPSRVETLGNVILEGWAHGLPVISTDTPGGKELIVEGDNGLLAPRENHEQLAAVCTDLLRQGASELKKLAKAGQETLIRDHTEEAVVSAYQNMYRQLLQGRR